MTFFLFLAYYYYEHIFNSKLQEEKGNRFDVIGKWTYHRPNDLFNDLFEFQYHYVNCQTSSIFALLRGLEFMAFVH